MAEDCTDPFAVAIEEVLEAVRRDGRVSAGALKIIMGSLERIVSQRGVPAILASDVAAEALARLIALEQAGQIDARGGAGLITEIAKRLAIDAARHESHSISTDRLLDQPSDDDQIAALIEAGADAVAIEQGMSRAFWAGDTETVRIVRAWLDLADELGRAPSSRESADACGTSHATVQRALRRFRELVPRPRA